MPSNDQRCPCNSSFTFGECCGPIHSGEPAPTAEALMRSRFTAFVTGNTQYLLDTWAPDTRPEKLVLDTDEHGVPLIRFYRLDILDVVQGGPLDEFGIVEFEAFYKGDAVGSQRERSTFRRVEGRWLYSSAV